MENLCKNTRYRGHIFENYLRQRTRHKQTLGLALPAAVYYNWFYLVRVIVFFSRLCDQIKTTIDIDYRNDIVMINSHSC